MGDKRGKIHGNGTEILRNAERFNIIKKNHMYFQKREGYL